MTIGRAVVLYLLPVTAVCGGLLWLHLFGVMRALRALGSAFWALSFALPEACKQFARVFRVYYRRQMESA